MAALLIGMAAIVAAQAVGVALGLAVVAARRAATGK